MWLSAGSAAGVHTDDLRTARRGVRQGQLANDCTTMAAIASGEWAAGTSGGWAAAASRSAHPWHAMPAEDVLALLGSSPQGITEAEAADAGRPPDPEFPGPGRCSARAWRSWPTR